MNEDRGTPVVHPRGPVVVGVQPRQSPETVSVAVSLASKLELKLVCGFVLSGLELSEWNAKTGINYNTLHADEREALGETEVDDLRTRLELAMDGTGVEWSLRVVFGDPAKALEELAVGLGASVLVIGAHTRKSRGFRLGGLQHSTVGHLLASRRVPVLVVPPARTAPRDITAMDP